MSTLENTPTANPNPLPRYDAREHAAWVRPAYEGAEAGVQPGVVVQGLFRQQERHALLHDKLKARPAREILGTSDPQRGVAYVASPTGRPKEAFCSRVSHVLCIYVLGTVVGF